MDRSLLDAHLTIERSKYVNGLDEELDKLKRRLRTEESRLVSEIEFNQNELYNLPYRSVLHNSPHRFRHRRDLSLI